MKATLIPAPSMYPQAAAQELTTGQCVRYPAGNFVIRLNIASWLSVNGEGRITVHKDEDELGHGTGDLMPTGTELYIKL